MVVDASDAFSDIPNEILVGFWLVEFPYWFKSGRILPLLSLYS